MHDGENQFDNANQQLACKANKPRVVQCGESEIIEQQARGITMATTIYQLEC